MNIKVDICGFADYTIDQFGNVWSTKKQLYLKTQINVKTGYCFVQLSGENKIRIKKYVHRLVAEAFLEKVPGKEIVNHIDANPRNNNLSNLEWCTQSENTLHSVKLGRFVGNKKFSQDKIDQAINLFKSGRYLKSTIATICQISPTHVSRIMSNNGLISKRRQKFDICLD